MMCQEWEALFASAEAKWRDLLKIMVERAPDDERLKALAQDETETPDVVAAVSQ